MIDVLLGLPIVFICLLFATPVYRIDLLRLRALWGALGIYILCILFLYRPHWLLVNFSVDCARRASWLFGSNLFLLSDGVSEWFLALSAFLIVICILVSWESIIYRLREFLILLFALEFLLFCTFSSGNILLFYIFFESVLIPMFLIIGIWGSRERRIYAAYQFFLYTFFGSIFMFLGIVYLLSELGNLDFDYLYRWSWILSDKEQIWLWLSFFFGLAIKIPMLPVHIWLPEAHVEAPTAGSVLLAGILLKLGGYGFIRLLLPLFPYGLYFFGPLLHTICVFSVIYSSCVTLRQVDLKKIIAYSSIAHMNFVTLGIISKTLLGVAGGMLLMLSHGIISSALFICIGILYDRYHSRLLFYYGGVVRLMPIFAVFFFFFTLGNMGFPGTANFVGELFVLLGVFASCSKSACFILVGTLLGGIYSIWLYNRVIFGNNPTKFFAKFSDVNAREVFVLLILSVLNFVIGIYPQIVFNLLQESLILGLLL